MTILWRYIIVPSKSTGNKITKLKKNKKNIVITLDNKQKIDVSSEALSNFYLYEGKTLTHKEINDIKNFDAIVKLMNYALSLLKKSHYSEWKMREKLYNKEGSKKDVDLIIKRLKEHDLINDKALMLDTIEYGNERNIGKNKIIQDLLNKGIFKENINERLFPHSLERKKALNNLPRLEKKYARYNYEQKKQHIYGALLSLGFDNDIALEAINHIKLPKDKEENDKLKVDFVKTYVRYHRQYEGYELKKRVVNSLHSKGYKVNEILKLWEKEHGENDF